MEQEPEFGVEVVSLSSRWFSSLLSLSVWRLEQKVEMTGRLKKLMTMKAIKKTLKQGLNNENHRNINS